MHRIHAATTLVFAVLCLAGTLAQDGAAPLSPEEMEAFLLNAELSDYRVVDIGVTGSQRATASDGDLAHDVHIQVVDQRRRVAAGEINFRDFYLYNVAAYRVAVLLGLNNVPMSVVRNVRGEPASVTWWVDDVAMDEAERAAQGTFGPDPAGTYQQLYTMYAFDELIKNVDRNQGNVLWTSDWKMWLIDHTRAFRLDVELSRPELMTRIGADLLERLRDLTPEELEEAVGDSLTGAERGSLLRRRDVLVQHFDELVEQRGAAAVVMAPLPAQEPVARPAQTAQVVEVGQTESVQSAQADQPTPAVQPEPAVQTSPLVGAAPLEPDQPGPLDPSEPAVQPEPAAQTPPPGQPVGAAPPEPEQPEQGALQPQLERAIALIEEGDFAAAADLLEAFTSGPVGEQRLSSEAREMVLAYLYYGIARLYLAGDDDARRAFQDAQRLDPAYEPEASALPRRVVELWQEVRNLGALVVITAPDAAAVYLDGEMRGYAPVDVAMLAPGDYRVTVTREGYLDDTRVVTVVSGGESTIRVEMAPAEAESSAVEEAAAGATGGAGQPVAPPGVGGGGLGTGAIAGIAGAAGAAVGLGVAVGGGGDPPAPTPTPRPDPPASAPSAPSAPRLSAGDGELVASWTAPSDNGSRIDDYDVRYRPSSGGGWAELPDGVKSTSTTATITGLRNGTSYEVQVRAGNSVGDGPWSASSTATPVASASVPSAPSAPRLNAGDGELVASWAAPSDNGSRIDDYDVRYRPSGGGWTELPDEAKSTATTATITGLRNGTSYEVQVRAGNSVGDGPWSASSTATPVASASVPSAPPAPRLSAGDGELVASWTAPSDNGARIDDYDVRYRPSSGGGWTELPDGVKSTATTATITGLRNGTSYQVQVRAGNSAGDGPWSASAMGTPAEPVDKAVLIELYNATNGPNWINNTNWNTDAPLGEWYGVSTDVGGRVTRLNLPRNRLSGSIPSSLGSLNNLVDVRLDANTLTGSIPSSLGTLTGLQSLELSANGFTGSIPPSLGSLSNLRLLRLAWNELTGSIPSSLSSLIGLTTLDLGGNALTGSIPSWLRSFTSLRDLSLRHNQLTGSIPSWLGNLTELWWLALDTNQLSGSIPSSLGNLTSLSELFLHNNQLNGSIPSSLGNLTDLYRLLLYGNRLSGSIPAALCKFEVNPQQGDVYLPGCLDSDEDRAALVELYNATNGVNWDARTNWNSSEPLNRWYGVGTDENGRVAILRLRWDDNRTGAIPSSLGSLRELESLDLGGNRLNGSIPSSLGSLAKLRVLRLYTNELSGSIPAALCKFETSINPQRGGVRLPCESDVGGSLEARLAPGDGRLLVDWTALSEDGGEIDDYDVRYRPEGAEGASGTWTELPDATKSTATTAVITGLTNGTVYAVQVRAGNASGDGAWSASVRATPASVEGLSFDGAWVEDQRWRQYSAVALLELPAATGGEGTVTYGLSPALPAGLVFDAAARTIDGAATEASAAAAYTYTATDASGASASLSFTVEVEVSPEESALRRDALAAQGRALLSSVTGVIGERFRARPSSSDGEARGGANGLVQGLASMLGLRAGRSFGGGVVRPALGTATGPGGLPGLGGVGTGGHASAAGLGPGGHGGMGRLGPVPAFGLGAGLGGVSAPGSSASLGGYPVHGGGMPGGHLAAGSAGGLVGASGLGPSGFGDAAPGLGPLGPGMGAGGWDDLVLGRSFAAPLSVGEDSEGASRYTVWGAGDRQSFSGSPAAGRYSGDMRSLYLGADRRLGGDWLAGAALGRSWGSADYQASVGGASAGRLTTLLTSVYPYVRGRVSRSLELWAVGGYGRGSAADARAGGAPGAPGGLRMTMGAAGLRQDVLERGGMALAVVGGMGSLSLSSSGGGLTVSGLGAGVHQGRLAVEASRASGSVSPFVQFGGRYDGGDGETGAGVELVAGLRASTSRVDLEARGRWLTVHSASGYSEYGAMARLAVKSRADGTGLQATLSPRWGMAEELRFDDGMLGAAGVSRLGRGGAWMASGQALSLEGEVGYGWRSRRLRGVMSPLTSYRRTGFGGDLTQVGVSYLSSEALWGALRMQFTLGRERWYEQTAGYRAAVMVASMF